MHQVFCSAQSQDGLRGGSQVGAECGKPEGRRMGDGMQQRGHIIYSEGWMARQQFEHDDAERINIRASIHLSSRDLFWRHVGGRTHHHL